MKREEVRILIVEDDADAATVLQELLELDGYSVRVAGTASHALEQVADFEPSCVMLDLGLPDMDGLELARQLRRAHGSTLILVAVTGRSGDAQRVAAETAGVDFVMVKPVDPKLLARIFPSLA